MGVTNAHHVTTNSVQVQRHQNNLTLSLARSVARGGPFYFRGGGG